MCARFSKDESRSLIFAGGAGRNELRAWDNDTDGSGRFKEVGHINDNRGVIMAMDTSINGKQVAWGNHLGQIFVSNFDLNGEEDQVDLRTIQGRLQHKRSKS